MNHDFKNALKVFNKMIEYGESQMEMTFEELLNNMQVSEAKMAIRAALLMADKPNPPDETVQPQPIFPPDATYNTCKPPPVHNDFVASGCEPFIGVNRSKTNHLTLLTNQREETK